MDEEQMLDQQEYDLTEIEEPIVGVVDAEASVAVVIDETEGTGIAMTPDAARALAAALIVAADDAEA